MRNILMGVASLTALSFASAGHTQGLGTLAADAAAFGSREAVAAPDLSSDGSLILYLTPGPGRKTMAVIGNLALGQFTKVVGTDGNPESLRWCGFASIQRIVCNFGGLVENKSDGDLLGFSRLVSIDSAGNDAKMLGQASSPFDGRLRQDDGDIIDWLPETEGAVLMSREYVPEVGKIGSNIINKLDGRGVDRIDVATLRRTAVESPRKNAHYMTDGSGNVRLMSITGARDSGMLTGSIKYLYRTKTSSEWQSLATVTEDEFVPLAVDGAVDSLYALKKKDGRYALYSVKLDGSMTTNLVAENPRVDIDNVVRIGEGQRVIGYTYAEAERTTVYFDPEFKALSASLSKALPNLPLISFSGASKDGRKLLIFAGSDSDPGRYYLFDRNNKSLNEAMRARPELQGRAMASVKSVTIPGTSGVSIPAYLTIPAGRDAKGLPAVILPHGGPSARDEWGFDWLAQFLAARGFAVLQPQYRGSAGFGDAWLNENGYRNWRTSIGDISTSARWLASQGIANPDKMAIVGWSYGGYAALQSAAVEPSLYKAVVAIAPVTDLAMLKLDSRNFVNANLRAKQIGSGPHVAEGSPLRNASAIAAPVLLVHGKMDANVRFAHSQRMDAALRGAGKNSELLSFDGLAHGLDDSNARTEMLTRIGALLDRTIGR